MKKSLGRKSLWLLMLMFIGLGLSAGNGQTQQNLPDAPSAKRPPNLPTSGPATSPVPAQQQRESSSSSSSQQTQQSQENQPPPTQSAPTAPTQELPPKVQRADQGTYTFPVTVNQVFVPVTVKDQSGKVVQGLLKNDFAIYENGVRQNINFFTSDPFPMAVAVVVDMGMSETTLRKVKEGLDALTGAFSAYDQVAVYTYAGTVTRMTDFAAAGDQLSKAIQKIQARTGRTGGFAVAGGPMTAGPSVNGRPIDPGQTPNAPIIPKESRVLNDALLTAALDLAKVERAKRRVIMVISDGKESNSNTSYSDVLKLLLTHEISVYAIGVDAAAIPLYRKLESINLPGTYNANILPKFASATGGEVFPEYSRSSIESAYAAVTEQARNQYTLGYTVRTLAGNYREIDVHVHRPGLRVYAKTGYYPLPPQSH
ncbi:MAG TPA: VWA domain-containing protein [Terriglobales bacterium]